MRTFYTESDYEIFKIPKRSGGYRQIEAPKKELKELQLKYKEIIYDILPVSKYAHGFVRGRSIVTNAIPHVNKKYILKLDIKDFFPSIKYDAFISQIKYVNKNLREYHTEKIKEKYIDIFKNVDNFYKILRIFFIDDRLPQGGPLSPHLSNVYMNYFDNTIADIIVKYSESCVKYDKIIPNLDYTRYADDITISGDYKKGVWFCYYKILDCIENLNLKINKKKIRFIPYYKRQLVTGIVVNKKINLPKETRKRLRAMKHQLDLGKIDLDNHRKGMLSYEHMIYLQKDLDVEKISFEVMNKMIAQEFDS